MEIIIELDELASTAMNEIRRQTKMDDSAVLSRALAIMQWALKQLQERRIVASLDESQHTYRELDLDAALGQTQVAPANVAGGKKKAA